MSEAPEGSHQLTRRVSPVVPKTRSKVLLTVIAENIDTNTPIASVTENP